MDQRGDWARQEEGHWADEVFQLVTGHQGRPLLDRRDSGRVPGSLRNREQMVQGAELLSSGSFCWRRTFKFCCSEANLIYRNVDGEKRILTRTRCQTQPSFSDLPSTTALPTWLRMEALMEVLMVLITPTKKRSKLLYVIHNCNTYICSVQDVTAASTGKEWDLDTQDSPEAPSRIITRRTSWHLGTTMV